MCNFPVYCFIKSRAYIEAYFPDYVLCKDVSGQQGTPYRGW